MYKCSTLKGQCGDYNFGLNTASLPEIDALTTHSVQIDLLQRLNRLKEAVEVTLSGYYTSGAFWSLYVVENIQYF